MFSVVNCLGKSCFSLFCLNFSPKTSLNIPSLHNVSNTQEVKTTCVVSLETLVNFLQACRGFHFERNRHHGNLYDLYCLKSKVTVFILFPFSCIYNVCRLYCSFSCKYRRYQLQWVGFQYWSFTKGRDKGTLPFYNQSFDFHEFFPLHSTFFMVIIIQVTAV